MKTTSSTAPYLEEKKSFMKSSVVPGAIPPTKIFFVVPTYSDGLASVETAYNIEQTTINSDLI